MAALATFPYVAKYKDGTQKAGIVILVTAPRSGIVLYVPSSAPGSPIYEVMVGDQDNVYKADIEPYLGTVKINNFDGSTLEIAP